MREHIWRVILAGVELATRLPGWVVFYNGEGAGATIIRHFHFQCFRRPASFALFPIEREAETASKVRHGSPLFLKEYPVASVYFRGDGQRLVEQVVSFIETWVSRHLDPTPLSCNLVFTNRGPSGSLIVEVFFIARDKGLSRAPELVGMPACIELVIGELVLSHELEKERLLRGQVNYEMAVRVQRAVEPPGEREIVASVVEEIRAQVGLDAS